MKNARERVGTTSGLEQVGPTLGWCCGGDERAPRRAGVLVGVCGLWQLRAGGGLGLVWWEVWWGAFAVAGSVGPAGLGLGGWRAR